MYYAKQLSPKSCSGFKELEIGIFNKETNEQIGSYKRNYSSYGEETFAPFKQKGKWYALYSSDYTATRIMSLPDCKDLGGEEPDGCGFCPTELYVPDKDKFWSLDDEEFEEVEGTFGFVQGCIWGDDTSWKIEMIDLSQASEGIIKRWQPFGYFEGSSKPLAECVDLNLYELDNRRIGVIPSYQYFDFYENNQVIPWSRRWQESQYHKALHHLASKANSDRIVIGRENWDKAGDMTWLRLSHKEAVFNRNSLGEMEITFKEWKRKND